MGSWTCSLCDTDDRWSTKYGAMEHIRENHINSLLRASLERDEKQPNVPIESDLSAQSNRA
jgi:hypothetical protein